MLEDAGAHGSIGRRERALVTRWIDAVAGASSPWLYVAVALLAAAESAALVGLVVPGETALLVGGFAASQGRVSLPLMIGLAAVAAVIGDSIGYKLGRHFGPRVRVTRLGRWVGDERWRKGPPSPVERGAGCAGPT